MKETMEVARKNYHKKNFQEPLVKDHLTQYAKEINMGLLGKSVPFEVEWIQLDPFLFEVERIQLDLFLNTNRLSYVSLS